MKINNLLFLISIFININCASQNKQKLFFSVEHGNKVHKELLKKTKMDSMIIFYQNEFVLGNNLKFDKKLMTKAILKRIPNKNQKGYAVLDWEGKANQILLGIIEADDKHYIEVRNNFIECVKFAKKLRPNFKWSIYNYVPIYYGKVNDAHDALVRKKIMPILKSLDFLSPSLYVLDDKTEKSDDFELYDYAQNNTQYAIKLGLELKKPVFPFVWHRYSDHSKSSFGLVELDRFEKFANVILKSSYNEKKIDGIIWWDCESYIYNNKNIFKSTKMEFTGITNKDNYQNIIYSYYYNRIIKSISKK